MGLQIYIDEYFLNKIAFKIFWNFSKKNKKFDQTFQSLPSKVLIGGLQPSGAFAFVLNI